MENSIKEPDWELLIEFGLPLNHSETGDKNYSADTVIENIVIASEFLLRNQDTDYNRNYDAFRGLLLALKTHYPTMFAETKKKSGKDLTELFDLDNISGRDIKLRNICLTKITDYFRKNTVK